MRRSEREITSQSEISQFICSQKIMRVGFVDEGEIYIVPLNYGFVEEDTMKLYFHGATAGRKYTLALQRPRVGFEIDGDYKLVTSDTACKHSAMYQSVIGCGSLRIVEDESEKEKGLNAIMKQATGNERWEYSKEAMLKCAVFCIEIEKLSCKAH